jgi:hypothetical protein
MKHRLRTWLLVLAGLAAALGGCGGAGQQTPPRDGGGSPRTGHRQTPPSDADAIRRLLARRATALERGAADAYTATATGRQVRRDRRALSNAAELPLESVELRMGEVELAGRRAWARVHASYELRGIAGRFSGPRRIAFVQTAGGWRVRRESGSRARAPWEVARFRPHRSRHFLVLAPAGIDPSAAGMLDALEAGYQRTREILVSAPLRRRYLVIVTAGPGQTTALTQSIRGVEALAALADAEVRERGAARRVSRVSSLRLMVVWPRFRALDAADRLRVVTHELTHAVLAPDTSGRTPSWLLEGVALYASDDRRVATAAQLLADPASSVRRALTLRGLSRPEAIARLDGRGQQAAYAYSSAAAFYVAERYGKGKLLALYDVFNDEKLVGRPGAAVVDRATRRVLDTSLGRLNRELRAWIAGG